MSKIYYNSAGRICSIDLADSTISELCESEEYVYVIPRLSPNNDKIIFIARALDGSTNEYLFISNIDGSDVHALIPDSTVTSCDWSK
jgi:Tol biopolymer transport system component